MSASSEIYRTNVNYLKSHLICEKTRCSCIVIVVSIRLMIVLRSAQHTE